MSRQSLSVALVTVLLVCTWIVFMVIEVHAIPNHKYVQCQEMLQRITRPTEAIFDVYVNPKKLQMCINLWAKWSDKLIRTGRLSPNPWQLNEERKQMLTQRAMQTRRHSSKQVKQQKVVGGHPLPARVPPARSPSPSIITIHHHPRPGQVRLEQPNMVAGVQQPQSSVVTLHEVIRELDKIRTNHPSNLQPNPNEPSLSRAPPVRPPSPGRPRLEQVAPEQPNVVVTMQQPQSSVATLSEVIRELDTIWDDKNRVKSRLRVALSTDCMTLIDSVLATPNPPIPTEMRFQDYVSTVQDCVKVWEKLRDKAAGNQQKQTALANELGLLTQRLKRVLEIKDARREDIVAAQRARKKARKNALKDLKRGQSQGQMVEGPVDAESRTRPSVIQFAPPIAKFKNPPAAASGKEPGSSGSSNRNIDFPLRHRSKHSK